MTNRMQERFPLSNAARDQCVDTALEAGASHETAELFADRIMHTVRLHAWDKMHCSEWAIPADIRTQAAKLAKQVFDLALAMESSGVPVMWQDPGFIDESHWQTLRGLDRWQMKLEDIAEQKEPLIGGTFARPRLLARTAIKLWAAAVGRLPVTTKDPADGRAKAPVLALLRMLLSELNSSGARVDSISDYLFLEMLARERSVSVKTARRAAGSRH